MLFSDLSDPAGAGSTNGAQEVYVVFRNTPELEKITGSAFKFGPVGGMGVTGDFDMNAKTDAGYNSKKRMVVLGPTLMVDVPGFLNVSLLAIWESNTPCNTFSNTSTLRYSYKTHPMLTAAWGIPLGKDTALSFEDFANFIAPRATTNSAGRRRPRPTSTCSYVRHEWHRQRQTGQLQSRPRVQVLEEQVRQRLRRPGRQRRLRQDANDPG